MAAKNNPKQAKSDRDRLRSFQARQESFERRASRRKRDNRIWGITAGVVVLAAVGAQVGFSITHAPGPKASSSTSTTGVPSKAIAQDSTWTGVLTINGLPLGVTLDGAKAPQAVSSTISLAQKGFYNGVSCHRLTTSGIFVLQCGDPKGDGTGGPGYSYGPIENAPSNDVYPVGTIAMARQGGNAASQGSQFFIVYDNSTIPSDAAGGYTVIGHVTSGLNQLMNNVIRKGVVSGSEKPTVTTTITGFTLAKK